MTEPKIQQVYRIEGVDEVFNTKQELQDFIRGPKVKAALNKVTGDNEELTTWLFERKELLQDAFDIGTIRRVTASDKKKLTAALEAVKELYEDGHQNVKFIAENLENIRDGFRYPPQKRMTDEEKAVAAKVTLMAETDNDEEVSDWIIKNKDAILEAFEAGKVKREVSPKATLGLAKHRVRAGMKRLEKAKAGGDKDEIATAQESLTKAEAELEKLGGSLDDDKESEAA